MFCDEPSSYDGKQQAESDKAASTSSEQIESSVTSAAENELLLNCLEENRVTTPSALIAYFCRLHYKGQEYQVTHGRLRQRSATSDTNMRAPSLVIMPDNVNFT